MIKKVILSSTLIFSSFVTEAGINGYFRIKENTITAFQILPGGPYCTDSDLYKNADGRPQQVFSRSYTIVTQYGTFTGSTDLMSGYDEGCESAKKKAFSRMFNDLQFYQKVNTGDIETNVNGNVKSCTKKVIDILVEDNKITAGESTKITVKCP